MLSHTFKSQAYCRNQLIIQSFIVPLRITCGKRVGLFPYLTNAEFCILPKCFLLIYQNKDQHTHFSFSLWCTFSRFILLAQPDCFHFPQVFYNGLLSAVQVYSLTQSDLEENSGRKNFSSCSRETWKSLAPCVEDKDLMRTLWISCIPSHFVLKCKCSFLKFLKIFLSTFNRITFKILTKKKKNNNTGCLLKQDKHRFPHLNKNNLLQRDGRINLQVTSSQKII